MASEEAAGPGGVVLYLRRLQETVFARGLDQTPLGSRLLEVTGNALQSAKLLERYIAESPGDAIPADLISGVTEPCLSFIQYDGKDDPLELEVAVEDTLLDLDRGWQSLHIWLEDQQRSRGHRVDVNHLLEKWHDSWQSTEVQERLLGHHRPLTLGRLRRDAQEVTQRLPPGGPGQGLAELCKVLDDMIDVLLDHRAAVPTAELAEVAYILEHFDAPNATIETTFDLLSQRLTDWINRLTDAIASAPRAAKTVRSLQNARVEQQTLDTARIQLQVARSMSFAGAAQGAQESTERLAGREADREQGSYFTLLAASFERRATRMMQNAIASVATFTVAPTALHVATSSGWQESLSYTLAASPFLGLAAYFGRESSQDRRSGDTCRRLSTQLLSFDAFIEPLTQEQQQRMREHFGAGVFALNPVEPSHSIQPLPTELISAAESLVRAVQEPRKP